LVAALAIFFGGLGWILRDRAARLAETRREVLRAIEQARLSQSRGQWADAEAAAQRVEGLLAGNRADEELLRQAHVLASGLEQDRRDRRILARLAEADVLGSQVNVAEGRFGWEPIIPEYEQAFREYGIDARSMTAEAAAAQILGRPLAIQLALSAALDRWESLLMNTPAADPRRSSWLTAVVQTVDTDPWSARIRDAAHRKDIKALEELARSYELIDQPPLTLRRLAWLLVEQAGNRPLGIVVLRRAQQRYPGDFWINHTLGFELRKVKPPQFDEAIRFASVAVALQPDNAGALVNLGNALRGQVKREEAIVAYRRAIERKPDYADAYNNLGAALEEVGQRSEAIAMLRKAIALKPDLVSARNNLANLLDRQGKSGEAIAMYRRLIAIKADTANTRNGLGSILQQQGKLTEALAEYRAAIQRKPDFGLAHYNLAGLLQQLGQQKEAIREYRQAIASNPDFAEAHCNLGLTLQRTGEFAEGLIHLKRGHELGSRNPRWPYASGQWVAACQRLNDLEARLAPVLAGRQKVTDARDCASCGELCYAKKQYEQSARFYEEAMAREPSLAADPSGGLRYNAACSAALAAFGEGQDAGSLVADERARRRRQARDWLRADLQEHDRALKHADAKALSTLVRTLQHWLSDPDLKGLREEDDLVRLPPEERGACAILWRDVRAVLARAQAK
jgi:tetratricopeptide (TPR) repeat protein